MQEFEHNRRRNDAIFQRRNESEKFKFKQIHRCDWCKVICNRKSNRILRKESIFNQINVKYWNFTKCVNAITQLEKLEFRTHLIKNCIETAENYMKQIIKFIFIEFRDMQNFEKFKSKRINKKRIEKDQKSRQFYVISIFEQKN